MKIARLTVFKVDLLLAHPTGLPDELPGGRLTFEAPDATPVRPETGAAIIGPGEGRPRSHSCLRPEAPGLGVPRDIAALGPPVATDEVTT